MYLLERYERAGFAHNFVMVADKLIYPLADKSG